MDNKITRFTIDVMQKVVVTPEDIDDIMATALDSITYWCGRTEVFYKRLGKYNSDQISRGGTLILFDAESDEKWELRLSNFLQGLKLALEQDVGIRLDFENGKLHICDFDGDAADAIVQLALFGEVVFS